MDKAESKYNPDAGISKEDEERYQKLLCENEDLQRLIVQVSFFYIFIMSCPFRTFSFFKTFFFDSLYRVTSLCSLNTMSYKNIIFSMRFAAFTTTLFMCPCLWKAFYYVPCV